MTLWIRSQNKELLMQVKYLHINAYAEKDKDVRIYSYGNDDFSYLLGTYKTKERALEVLDEIQDIIISTSIIPLENNDAITCGSAKVYEMPEE